jgi:hypothetical protein
MRFALTVKMFEWFMLVEFWFAIQSKNKKACQQALTNLKVFLKGLLPDRQWYLDIENRKGFKQVPTEAPGSNENITLQCG